MQSARCERIRQLAHILLRSDAFRLAGAFSEGTRTDRDDNKVIEDKVPMVCDAIKAFALSGMQFAMCHYNNK